MEPLKNMLNEAFFDSLIGAMQAAYPAFDRAAFLGFIHDDRWETRELKERIRHTTLGLGGQLPADYRAALDVLRRSAPHMREIGFATMVLSDFVEVYGLDDYEASIPALEEFTQIMSAEFAVRPFIVRYPERMLAQMLAWTGHPSHHVRRLASEGCRPRLPWGIALPALKADPSPILPILDALKLDEAEWVRRSVANNLNDIAKDNPGVVIAVLRRWNADHPGPEIDWITRQALRTLVKQGHPDALALVGVAASAAVEVHDLCVAPDPVPMGGEVTFTFEVVSTGAEPQDLVIDYIVHHMRANGEQTPKVFKLARRSLAPGERLTLTRRHSFKPVTTRRYYPGAHAIEIQVNGARLARRDFSLTP